MPLEELLLAGDTSTPSPVLGTHAGHRAGKAGSRCQVGMHEGLAREQLEEAEPTPARGSATLPIPADQEPALKPKENRSKPKGKHRGQPLLDSIPKEQHPGEGG